MIYAGLRVLARLVFGILFRLEAIGLDHIPKQGPVILCSNHISYWDPPILATPLSRKLHFMAKEELFRIPVFNWMIRQLGAFPVKRGGVSKQSIQFALDLLQQGEMMCIFPQGTRNKTVGMGKKGAASLALRSDAVVIPVAIIGQYKWFRKMTLVFGPPVDLSAFKEAQTSDQLQQATEKIMQSIRDLMEQEKTG